MPGWLFWAAALMSLAGPFAFGSSEAYRGHIRIFTRYLSVPFALTSIFLALSTRKPRCTGAALWVAAATWLAAVLFLMVPIHTYAINRDVETYLRMLDVQGLVWGFSGLAFVAVALRAIAGRDGWELPLPVRATHTAALLVLAGYLGRGALLVWGADALSAGPGVAAMAWEVSLGHYIALIAAALMALSVGARYVRSGG